MILNTVILASVASVSVGVSVGLKHFSLYLKARNLGRAQKRAKSEKCLERAEKPRKHLLRRLLLSLSRAASFLVPSHHAPVTYFV